MHRKSIFHFKHNAEPPTGHGARWRDGRDTTADVGSSHTKDQLINHTTKNCQFTREPRLFLLITAVRLSSLISPEHEWATWPVGGWLLSGIEPENASEVSLSCNSDRNPPSLCLATHTQSCSEATTAFVVGIKRPPGFPPPVISTWTRATKGSTNLRPAHADGNGGEPFIAVQIATTRRRAIFLPDAGSRKIRNEMSARGQTEGTHRSNQHRPTGDESFPLPVKFVRVRTLTTRRGREKSRYAHAEGWFSLLMGWMGCNCVGTRAPEKRAIREIFLMSEIFSVMNAFYFVCWLNTIVQLRSLLLFL